MSSGLGRAARPFAAATLALLVVLAIAPGRLPLALRVYALVLCAVGLGLALGAVRSAYPAATELRGSRKPRSRPRRPPPDVARLENIVALGVTGALDLHLRLAPRLRLLAADLLSSRRRVSLSTEPAAARAILGEETWAVVRPDRPTPADRLGGGLPASELRRIIETLERV